MLTDDQLAELYTARGVPTEWREITPPEMAPSFRYFFRALPSPSANFTGAEDAELLIHNPLKALKAAKIGETDECIIGREATPHISTMVVNHEKTLRRFVMGVTVVASTNPSSVGITIVKEEAPGDEDFDSDEDGTEAT
jgi:hypothetical protein